MKKNKFRLIIGLIAFTAVITVTIQVYRNVQNYQLNKARFFVDVQQALDNGVEAYYADLAKDDFITFFNFEGASFNPNDSISVPYLRGSTWVNADTVPSTNGPTLPTAHVWGSSASRDGSILVRPGNITRTDSTIQFPVNGMTGMSNLTLLDANIEDTLINLRDWANRVVVSLTRSTVDFPVMQKFVEEELARAELDISYDLVHYNHDSVVGTLNGSEPGSYALSTKAKPIFMPRHQELEMRFDNASLIILKRGMTDLLISVLISVSVIGSLLYLYYIINRQKQLAEIKNDLISNITHEFKTPIATVTTAIDGIVNFNRENDQQKTEKYLDISSAQLEKLNHMVEKLLETATLDSDKLLLTLEEVDISKMLDNLSEKYRLIAKEKKINFHTDFPSKVVQADLFHLENAISNLIDNAVKYGGSNIDIWLSDKGGKVEIKVVDDGQNIDKSQKDRIFDKFYRIPTGNRHDVKGFGIGLYYTKKIIEKHGGSILLNLDANKTSFEVAF